MGQYHHHHFTDQKSGTAEAVTRMKKHPKSETARSGFIALAWEAKRSYRLLNAPPPSAHRGLILVNAEVVLLKQQKDKLLESSVNCSMHQVCCVQASDMHGELLPETVGTGSWTPISVTISWNLFLLTARKYFLLSISST